MLLRLDLLGKPLALLLGRILLRSKSSLCVVLRNLQRLGSLILRLLQRVLVLIVLILQRLLQLGELPLQQLDLPLQRWDLVSLGLCRCQRLLQLG
ncbi:MAG: hypothetical protein ACK55I_06670, partial [bacterium]